MNISAYNPLFVPKNVFLFLLSILLLVYSFQVCAVNIDSEKRWAEQLRDNIVIGDPLDLPLSATVSEANTENTFFSIFTPHETEKPKGAVILMHGSGAHPDWSDIIHPLRAELPDRGWATLSIQLPLTFPDKKDSASQTEAIQASAARIQAAIKFLEAKTYSKIVLVAHSFGTLMALDFLQLKSNAISTDGTPLVAAAIIIGTPSSGTTAPLNSPVMIEKIKLPLLDLYGSKDLDSVMRSAKARKTAAKKAHNKNYRQVETIGANHFYHGLNDELVSYVNNWLNKTLYPK